MEGVIGRPDGGALGGEGIDRPIVFVLYSFLAVVENVEESRVIHVQLVGDDTDYGACSSSV